MLVNRTKIIVMTVIATLLYLLIMNAVDETPFMKDLFAGDWTGAEDAEGNSGSWLAWLGLILIPALGLYSAYQLGDKEIDVEPDRDVHTDGQVTDPGWWKAVSGNTWLSVIWLPLRFAIGIHWLQAGWHKTQEAGWAKSGTDPETGEFVERGSSMAGFLERAYTPNPDTGRVGAFMGAEGWYAETLKFLVDNNWTSWFGPLIAWGEFLVGVGLLVGGLVGIAAFFGTLMNMSFMLAGTVSSNPWMFALTVFLILGWKVAGHYGLDRYLLPALGTPWGRRKQDDHVPTAGTGAGTDQYAARV